MDDDRIEGRRLEEDWEHALDAAGNAVDTTSRANILPRSEAATATERLRGERKWLRGFKSSLHRLFPSRSERSPDADLAPARREQVVGVTTKKQRFIAPPQTILMPESQPAAAKAA